MKTWSSFANSLGSLEVRDGFGFFSPAGAEDESSKTRPPHFSMTDHIGVWELWFRDLVILGNRDSPFTTLVVKVNLTFALFCFRDSITVLCCNPSIDLVFHSNGNFSNEFVKVVTYIILSICVALVYFFSHVQ